MFLVVYHTEWSVTVSTHSQVNKKQALKLFLIRKLESLTDQQSTQQTMLTTWLIELYLNELGNLLDDGQTEQHARVQEEFHMLLAKSALKVSEGLAVSH